MKMVNQLADSSSPYLLQHANNPVEWYPWGEIALNRSRAENKPIFLSIGYAACHWCHVMAHESFEDPETAEIMNMNFVNIKVDREERPDLDHIYMTAVVSMVGQGGWPMSVFLTPDLQPFYGGTYFPPVSRYNMPAFKDILLSVAKTWQEDQDRIRESGSKISDYIRRSQKPPGEISELDKQSLDQAAASLASSYDWQHGGWGSAPKFPQPMAIEFLLRRAAQGDRDSLSIARHALDAMSAGGMYDLIGGGFARYSTDNQWLVPHFEKMLYDNALLARAYLHMYLISGEQKYRAICTQTLNFVMREMTHPQGGFYSSLDADSEGMEGKFYVWTEEEIRTAFSDPNDADFIFTAYGFSKGPNFEGKVIPRWSEQISYLAEKYSIQESQIPAYIAQLNQILLKARERRVRPGTDDKVIVAWNGLMASVFSEAGRYLNFGYYKEMATRNLNFILNNMKSGEFLMRSWREGKLSNQAFLDDYASLIMALLAHYQTDPDKKWFQAALDLNDTMLSKFSSPDDLFYDAPVQYKDLLFRPRDIQDNATPAGNSLAASALLLLAAYQGEGSYRSRAERNLSLVQSLSVGHPTAFSNWLCAIDLALHDILEVAIVAEPGDNRETPLVDMLWSSYRPNVIAAIGPPSPENTIPALLNQRTLLNGAPTAYVCQNFACLQPVNKPELFQKQLEGMTG